MKTVHFTVISDFKGSLTDFTFISQTRQRNNLRESPQKISCAVIWNNLTALLAQILLRLNADMAQAVKRSPTLAR